MGEYIEWKCKESLHWKIDIIANQGLISQKIKVLYWAPYRNGMFI